MVFCLSTCCIFSLVDIEGNTNLLLSYLGMVSGSVYLFSGYACCHRNLQHKVGVFDHGCYFHLTKTPNPKDQWWFLVAIWLFWECNFAFASILSAWNNFAEILFRSCAMDGWIKFTLHLHLYKRDIHSKIVLFFLWKSLIYVHLFWPSNTYSDFYISAEMWSVLPIHMCWFKMC